MSYACAISLRHYSAEINNQNDPYTFCLNHGLLGLIGILKQKHGKNFSLSVFYESGHKHSKQAYKEFQNINFDIQRPKFRFIGKSESGCIQAADALILHYSKFIKDYCRSRKKARKDFQFLMEKRGIFFNIAPQKHAYSLTGLHNDHFHPDENDAHDAINTFRDFEMMRRLFSEYTDIREIVKEKWIPENI